MLADKEADGGGAGGTCRDGWLGSRIGGYREWLARCDGILHRGGHDGAQVSVCASSPVGWDGCAVLFQLIAENG